MTEARDAVSVEGGDAAEDKVTEYLKKKADSLENEGELRIKLFQKVREGERPIEDFVYDFSGPVATLAEEIVECAEDQAIELRGKVSFGLSIDGISARCQFYLKAPRLDDDPERDAEDFEEGPSKVGILGQLMRHQEVSFKEALGAQKGATTILMKQIEHLTTENIMLKKQHFDSMKLVEELRNMSFARDLEVERMKREEARKDKAVAGLGQALPILAHKFLGPGAPQAMAAMAGNMPGMGEPQHDQSQQQSYAQPPPAGVPQHMPFARSEIEIMVEQLFSTIREDQVMALLGSGIFEMPQLALFKTLHDAVIRRKEVENAAKEAAANAASRSTPPPGETGRAAASRWGYRPDETDPSTGD